MVRKVGLELTRWIQDGEGTWKLDRSDRAMGEKEKFTLA